VLEVVGPQVICAPPRGPQREEELEQAHRRLHAHIHLTEVDEDCHQGNGLQCQMVELETIVLQQREKKGGCSECEPDQGTGGEENNLAESKANKQNDTTSNLPILL
jgi:hypothetical protein